MRHRIKKIPNLSTLFSHASDRQNLLHSDKSTYSKNSYSRWSISTLFLGARHASPSSRVSCARPRRNSGSPAKKVFTRPADTYFYKHSMVKNIPLILPVFAFLLVLGCMINPIGVGTEEVAAASITEDECRGNTRIALSLNGTSGDSVNLVNNNVEQDITNGTISKLSQDFNVIACNVKNYKLYVQAESSLLKNTSAPDALLGVGDNVAEAAFPENTWGYNLSPQDALTDAYSTMPDLNNPIPEAYTADKGTTYQGQNFTISFAAKFGSNKTAGHYTSDILLSMVADPNITLSTITTMQEMTPVVCANSQENETKQLIDARDQKTYWVAKLKDNNCWMTQNLDLDLNVKDESNNIDTTTLTPETSDVAETWVVPEDLKSELWANEVDSDNVPIDATAIKYFDPGMYVNIAPTTRGGCVNSETIEGCHLFANVTGMNPSDNPTFGTEISDNTYNAHYAIGNYYSTNAATAGTAQNVDVGNGNATSSICPKGWQLPLSGRSGANDNEVFLTNKTFANLLANYGWSFNNNMAPLINEKGDDARLTPLFFFYGGVVKRDLITAIGGEGLYASSTIRRPGEYDYTAVFSDRIYPVNVNGNNMANSMIIGKSVRCVAK